MEYSFDATYDSAGAAAAERAFYVRSVLELRPLATFGPPCLFAAFAGAGWWLKVPWWFTAFFSVVFVLSVAGPLFFYVARPRAHGKLALDLPVRRVSLSAETFAVEAGGHRAVVSWRNVKHVWESGGYVLLVLGKYAALSVPRSSLPAGAYEFIVSSSKRAT